MIVIWDPLIGVISIDPHVISFNLFSLGSLLVVAALIPVVSVS